MKNDTLSKLFNDFSHDLNKKQINVNDLVLKFSHRGFGVFLIIPSVLLIIPIIGAIPGIPFLLGLCIAMLAVQMMIGKNNPWLPKKLLDINIQSQKIKSGITKIAPYAAFIDRHTKPRVTWLFNPPFINIMAVILLIFSLLIMFIGFIPFLPSVLAITILFCGVGMIANDGLIILIGLLLSGLIGFLCFMFF